MRILFVLFVLPAAAAAQTITFETLTFPGTAEFVNNTPFTIDGVQFNNDYNSTFDSWTGFSYSKVKDVTSAGFMNQYAAYVLPLPGDPLGAGAGGSQNYAVAYDGGFFGSPIITLPPGTFPLSVQVANTTYAALTMRDGDPFAKKFGGISGDDPDFFKLIFTGRDVLNNPTGNVEFFLADYTFANNALDYIVSDWTTVDLSTLGTATASIQISFESSDIGPFGINTPTFVALDNFVIVPEPATALIMALALVAMRRRAGAEGCA